MVEEQPIFFGGKALTHVRDVVRTVDLLLGVAIITPVDEFVTIEVKYAVTRSELARIVDALQMPRA